MKKFSLIVVCCMMLGLVACGGGDENVIERNPSDVTQAPDQEGAGASKDNKANGYVFGYKDVEIVIDTEANQYVEKLGDPVSYYETPSCAFDNLDKFYTYQGFEVDTYYMDGKDLVLGVVFLDDTVSTKEGVCIGDVQDKVTSVYGEPTQKTDNSATYQKDNMKLVFIFKDSKVASIEYKSLVLDAQ